MECQLRLAVVGSSPLCRCDDVLLDTSPDQGYLWFMLSMFSTMAGYQTAHTPTCGSLACPMNTLHALGCIDVPAGQVLMQLNGLGTYALCTGGSLVQADLPGQLYRGGPAGHVMDHPAAHAKPAGEAASAADAWRPPHHAIWQRCVLYSNVAASRRLGCYCVLYCCTNTWSQLLVVQWPFPPWLLL